METVENLHIKNYLFIAYNFLYKTQFIVIDGIY